MEVLKYLVEEGGASLRILAYDGMSCLHAATQTGKLDTVKWLVSLKNNSDALILLIQLVVHCHLRLTVLDLIVVI